MDNSFFRIEVAGRLHLTNISSGKLAAEVFLSACERYPDDTVRMNYFRVGHFVEPVLQRIPR